VASIRKRVGKKGTSYAATIRLGSGGKGYSESKTFPTKVEAKKWATTRESEILSTGVSTARYVHAPQSLAEAISRYRRELEDSPKGVGRSKKSNLKRMEKMEILKELPFRELDSDMLIGFIRHLLKEEELPDGQINKMSPATANEYLGNIRTLYNHADLGWSLGELPLKAIDKATRHCRNLGLVAKPVRRVFRPSIDDLNAVLSYWSRERTGKAASSKSKLPMRLIVLFGIFSARRISEICRLRWEDLDDDNSRILVRQMKHPTNKTTNDVWVTLPPRAMGIIKKMPRVDDRIFPFNDKSVGNAFTRAKKWAKVDAQFVFHTLRHEGTSHYFELDLGVEKVSMITGHQDWGSMRRYTHLIGMKTFDKYSDWSWLKYFNLESLPAHPGR